MYYYLFYSKVSKLLVKVKITQNFHIFMCLKGTFSSLPQYLFLCVFGHHGCFASKLFNPFLSFGFLKSSNHFDQKKIAQWAI